MNSFSSLAVPRSSGVRAPLVYGLLIVAMCCYGYFTLALVANDRDQAHISRLLEQLDQRGRGEVVDPKRMLVNLRLLLPQLSVIDPDGMEALRGSVDALEMKLVEQSRVAGATNQVLAELAGVHEAMFLRAATDRQRSRELHENLASLFVVFALIVFGWACTSRLHRVRSQAGDFSSLGNLVFSNVAVSVVVTDTADSR